MPTAENPQPLAALPESAPRAASSARRRPRSRIPVLVAAVLVAALLAAGAFIYRAGGFNDRGQFRAEPPACATVAPGMRLLGMDYVTEQDESNNCHLLLPRDHPAYVAAPSITVSFYVATPRRSDAPGAAGTLLRKLKADSPPLPGIGDEAYLRDRDVFLRVSNLVVAIVVFPRPISTEEQVRAFAADLANRVRNR
jgi:hypothetical protein